MSHLIEMARQAFIICHEAQVVPDTVRLNLSVANEADLAHMRRALIRQSDFIHHRWLVDSYDGQKVEGVVHGVPFRMDHRTVRIAPLSPFRVVE